MPVFPDANNFTIAGSSFTEVHGNSVHNSSNIVYNVYFTPRIDAQSQPMDNEKWKELVSNIEHVITKRQDGKSPDEVEDNTSNDIDTNKEEPVITKCLSIYTGVDIARKKLKTTPVEIVFTLTPTGSPPAGHVQWPTIVWKTLKFQPNNSIRRNICWYNKAGFCIVKEQDDTTLKPYGMSAIVKSKHLAILQDIDGSPDFSSHTEIPHETTDIAVINTLPSSQRFALCTVDPSRPETDQFLPVIDIGSLRSNGIFLCGSPVMLQAYVVCEFTERKPIDTSRLSRPLFVDSTGNSQPLDIRTLSTPTAFRLYSNSAGKIILEKD